MGRKHSTGQDADPEVERIGADSSLEVRSRTSLKRERVANEKALAKLVRDLLPLDVAKWEQLGVPEHTVDALLDAQKMRGNIATERQLRLVRAGLREADWTLVRRRLDDLVAGFAIGPAPERASAEYERWTEQLLVQGDPGLARFCSEHEHADRQRLRQLIRNVQRAPANKKAKTRIQLERAVQTVLEP